MKNLLQENTDVKLELIKSQAQANGTDAVKIKVITYQHSTETVIPGVDIILTVNGNALFKEVNTPIYKTKTGVDGFVIVDVVNNKIEHNIVECHLFNSGNISKSVTVSFYDELPIFSIVGVYNINHTFLENEPSILWDGAFFYIETKEGSGNFIWSADNEPEAFLFENISRNKVKITITKEIKKENILTCIDQNTQERVFFPLKIKKHALVSSNKVDYKDLIKNAKAHKIFSKLDYDFLFREWGPISLYPGWVKDDEYWTDEHNEIFGTVIIYNLDSGSDHKVIMDKYKLNYLFTVGSTPY